MGMPTAKKQRVEEPLSTESEQPRGDFLKLFWTLAESDAATRTAAAAQLLAHLQSHPVTFDDDVQYTLKRLVRGLASSRDAARQGFSAALAALLAAFPDALPLNDTLSLIKETMEVHASMKGMEQREHMFGRLFGLLALHRSERLRDESDVAVAVVKELVRMFQWKKWLREACVEALLAVLSDMPSAFFVDSVASDLATLLEGDIAAFNADQVALATGLQHYIHLHNLSSYLPATYPALRVVCRKHMHALVEPLKHSSSTFPRVHAAWFGLFGHIVHAARDATKQPSIDSELLQEAWTVLVENALLAPESATHERKGLALKLFELVLPTLPSPLRKALLTPNFVKCLYNNTTAKKTYLQDAARHTLRVFARVAPHEYVHFCQREFVAPMSALVDNKETAEDTEALSATVKSGGFDAIIAIEEERERLAAVARRVASVRQWALDLLLAELPQLEPTLAHRVLEFLVLHAFFTIAKTTTPSKKNKAKHKTTTVDAHVVPEPALSSTVRSVCVKRLFSLLLTTLHRADEDAETSVLTTAFTIALSFVREKQHALRTPLNDEDAALLASVESLVSEMTQGTGESTDAAFALLLRSTALQLLDSEQREDARGVVADLVKCCTDLRKTKDETPSKKSKKGKKKSNEDDASTTTDAVAVLTDLLLSLLSQDSSAMRDLVTHVFRDIVPLLNAASVQTLVQAIAPEDEEDDSANKEDDDVEMDEDEDEDAKPDEEIVLSSAADIADALRSDENLAELHREDQTLSMIAGQVSTKRKAKLDAKRHRMHVLHFKLRVLDLLCVLATKATTNALVVRLVEPLYTSLVAIRAQDVERRVLKERLQSVLQHKLIKAKDVPTLGTEDRALTLEALVRVVELLTSKTLDKDQSHVGAGVVVHYVRVLGHGDDSETMDAVRTALEPAVRDVLAKKHGKFPRSALDDLVTRFPRISVLALLPTLSAIASSEEDGPVDEFSRAEVFRLLSSLLKAKHVADESTKAAFATWRTPLLRAIVALLEPKKQQQEAPEPSDDDDKDDKSKKSKVKTQEGIKAKRLKVYLSFALHFVKLWNEYPSKKKTESLQDVVRVVEALETSSPVIKQLIKQLLTAAAATSNANTTQETPTKKGASKSTPTKKSPVKRKRDEK